MRGSRIDAAAVLVMVVPVIVRVRVFVTLGGVNVLVTVPFRDVQVDPEQQDRRGEPRQERRPVAKYDRHDRTGKWR
jgi:hypothetical protein